MQNFLQIIFIIINFCFKFYIFLFPDNRGDIGVFYLRVDNIVLSENAPGHESACDQELYSENRESDPKLGVGQSANKRPRSVFLHRMCVQRVVHPRNPR